jgi:hypothetical protein
VTAIDLPEGGRSRTALGFNPIHLQTRVGLPPWQNIRELHMKKLKHEAELFKAALLAGVRYAEGRKAVEFEATDSASEKALYIYRLLVHDKVISPMPEDQVSEKTIRHRLATWYARQLPDGHPLLE